MDNLRSAEHLCLTSTFDPSPYADVKGYVVDHRGTTDQLRRRIDEDEAIDPVDALEDARLLTELARVRLARRFQPLRPPCTQEQLALTLDAAMARSAPGRGWASVLDPLPYDHALRLVVDDARTRDRLRQRITEDAHAPAPDCALADAELLFELAKVRVRDRRRDAAVAAASVAVQPMEVVRDELGHFRHPGIPWSVLEESSDCAARFMEWGFEVGVVWFEGDASEELVDRYFEQADPDLSKWSPSAPRGAGWFVASIHDTESGPCCLWIRHLSSRVSDAPASTGEEERACG